MWIPRPDTANWEAPPGLAPWRELSDDEFKRLEEECGPEIGRWFEHNGDGKTKKGAARAAADGDD